jgi:hypothetical protein
VKGQTQIRGVAQPTDANFTQIVTLADDLLEVDVLERALLGTTFGRFGFTYSRSLKRPARTYPYTR